MDAAAPALCRRGRGEVIFMRRRGKWIALVLLAAALALLLAACAQEPAKHPLVAKWTQRYDDGRTQVTFSFEAIGDAEVYIWRYDDEEGRLVQTDYYWGDYTVDEADSAVALELENAAKERVSAAFVYATDGETLTLVNDEYDLLLERAAENSAKVR